ncbi:MAG: AAA family ATPase, partial [Planctomycetia bacterium]|nr:AAA family ATPase [Planctomycetia bacterium]
GGNDEREQTLNQILSEMDGFATNDIVIVIAATNRPDVLDPALLRPGRFDRHVTVSKPAQKGRVQLFEVHTKKVPLAEDVDVQRLAAMTTGLTGADIRNIVNEAALWACRNNEEKVQMADFYYAIDKILMGAKREEVISEEEKRMTAYHEAGHTLMAWLNPGRDRISKVSIIPRGHALGVTQLIPEEDRVSISQREIEVKLLISLGGREAEKLIFDELTAGAEGDLQYVTQLAQKMVTAWGMSSRIGPAAFRLGDEHPFLGKEMSTSRNFSDHTAQVIDEEIMRILNNASEKAAAMLRENRNKLDALAQALEIREELDESQIEQILGPPAYRENEPEKEEG